MKTLHEIDTKSANEFNVAHSDFDSGKIINPIEVAINTLKKAIQDDPDTAWAWHCVIAMSLQDGEFLKWKESNEATCKIMQTLFNVDSSPKFKELLKLKERTINV